MAVIRYALENTQTSNSFIGYWIHLNVLLYIVLLNESVGEKLVYSAF